MKYKHMPVMLAEVLEYLDPRSGGYFIDCTLGGAGYTVELAKKVGKKGKILAIDLDKMAIENAKLKLRNAKLNNVILANDNFKNIAKIVQTRFKGEKDVKFNGIVFDLGLSGAQLEDRGRGFSFESNAPLDMAFGRKIGSVPGEQRRTDAHTRTADIVNHCPPEELEKIIKEYGEERYAKNIAKKIIEARGRGAIKTTGQLVGIISDSVPLVYKNKKIHFATRAFQALRIATNDELGNLGKALPPAVNLLVQGGKIVVISYHSLEDRIVKNFFKKENRDCLCPPDFPVCRCGHRAVLKILTKKVRRPSEEEVSRNARARSAKMRVAEKI